MQNPYEPGTARVSENASAADVPASKPVRLWWRGARAGARIAACIAGAVVLLLITPVLLITVFAMASGRGFAVSSFVLRGIGIVLFFCALGGLIGAGAGLIGSLFSGRKVSPEAEAPIAREQLIAATRKRRPKRWPWIVGVPLVALLLVAVIAGAYFGNQVDRRLAAAVAAADADDPNWRLFDLLAHRSRIPDDQNSALVMDEVCISLPDNWPKHAPPAGGEIAGGKSNLENAFDDLNEAPANISLSTATVEVLRAELKARDDAVCLARTLANYRQGYQEVEIGPAVFDTLLPHVQRTRSVARMLTADAALRAHDGDIDGALDSCRAAIGAGRSIGDEPFMISHLVRIAITTVGLKATARALAQGEASDAALARMQDLVTDELAQPLQLIAVKGERASSVEAIRRVSDGEIPISALSGGSNNDRDPGVIAPWGKLLFEQQQAVALEWMNAAVNNARRPASERAALWKEWDANCVRVKESTFGRFTATLPILLSPAISSSNAAFSRSQCELGAFVILLAAERQRKRTGAWPASAAAIDRGILPIEPVDPFSGAPFRMVHVDGRLRVYSIGPNRKDDNGAYDPKRWPKGDDDVGAQVWDVSLRAKKETRADAGP